MATADVELPQEVPESTADKGTLEGDVVPTDGAPTENGVPAKKARVVRLPKPDDAEVKAKTEKLAQQIEKMKARVAEIQDLVRQKNDKRSHVSSEQQGVRNRLLDLKTKFQTELAKKQAYKAQLDEVTKSRDALRAQTRAARSDIKYTSVEDIDKQIERLEQKMQHSTQTLNEEKKTLDDIKKLKASRASVAKMVEQIQRLESDDSSRKAIVDNIKACDEELTKIKTEEEGVREQLNAIRAREQVETADVPALFKEREVCREVINKAYETIKQLRAEHKAKVDEYWAREKEWRAQRNEDRKRKQEEWEATKRERDAARKEREKEMAGEPYEREIASCDQLVAYLSKFVAEEAKAVEAQAQQVEIPEGMVALPNKKKQEEELEGWFGGLGGSKKGGKGKKGKRVGGPANGEATGAEAKETKLTHSLDILQSFNSIKVEVPLTTARITSAIEEINTRKAYYLDRRAKAKESGEDVVAEDRAEARREARANGKPNGISNESEDLEVGVLDSTVDEFPAIAGSGPASTADADGLRELENGISVSLSVTEDDEVAVDLNVSSKAAKQPSPIVAGVWGRA